MELRRRPLNENGKPVLVAAAGTVVFTTNATASTKGGPYPNQVTLWICNNHSAAQIVSIAIGNGSVLELTIAADSQVKALDDIPFVSSGMDITCTNVTNLGDMSAYGWFTAG